MTADLFAAELLKLRTLRLTAGLTGVVLALSVAIGVVLTQTAHRDGDALDLATVARGPAQMAWFFTLVVAVVASAGEFQHRTIRTTLLAAPVRTRVLAAKGAAVATYGAVTAAVAGTVGVVSAVVTASVTSTDVQASPGTTAGVLVAAAALGALWSLAGTGLGMLTRNVTIAVVAVLLWRLLLEGLLPSALQMPEVARWLPGAASDAALGLGDAMRLGAVAGTGVFAAYAGVLLAAAVLPFVRRDVA